MSGLQTISLPMFLILGLVLNELVRIATEVLQDRHRCRHVRRGVAFFKMAISTGESLDYRPLPRMHS
jgi:hypothetical protein